VAYILNVKTGKRRTLPAPSTPSAGCALAVAPDFRRLNDTRPGYGYAGLQTPTGRAGPEDAGIWRTDLKTANRTSFSLLPPPPASQPARRLDRASTGSTPAGGPGGRRFIFLHVARQEGGMGFSTRMFTATRDGKDLYVLDPTQDLALHLARPAARAGLGLASLERR